MSTPTSEPLCWICRLNPADTNEHRFKASDIRDRVPRISQRKPVFLQVGRATNKPIGSAKSKLLTYEDRLCRDCNNVRTQPYDEAWALLSQSLTSNWQTIRASGRFNLKRPFPKDTQAFAVDVHLFFLKHFGLKILEENVQLDLTSFADALCNRTPHPEITLYVAEAPRNVLAWNTTVFTWTGEKSKRVAGATWWYIIAPIAIKVVYILSGAPLMQAAGNPWHPTTRRRIIYLSPLAGIAEPVPGVSTSQ